MGAGVLAVGLVTVACGPPPPEPEDPFGGEAGHVVFGGWNATDLEQVVVQPDGKVLVTHMAYDGFIPILRVVRFLPDGTPDTEFGADDTPGSIDIVQGSALCAQLVLRPGGGIYLATHTAGVWSIYAYDDDGVLDTGFGDNGRATTGPRLGAMACAMAVQPDGKVVAAGLLDAQPLVARFTAEGQLDPTYGTGGMTSVRPTLPEGGTPGRPTGVFIQPDGGAIIGASWDWYGDTYDPRGVVLTRLTATGHADGAFGNGGTMVHSHGMGARGLLQRPDGRLVTVGRVISESPIHPYRMGIAQYTATGQLDPSFGTGGIATPVADAEADAAALLPDGSLVVAGRQYYDPAAPPYARPYRGALTRLTPSGALDTRYGQGGVLLVDDFPTTERLTAIARQRDGRLLIAGATAGTEQPVDQRLFLDRHPAPA